MLRLLHTADVHLGARHADLGERASLQRERQFAAFRATVDLAIAEHVDLVLIAGDLFDSNTQPRRSVERVASELGRLARASIRTVVIPGTHDVYDGASIYRAYDLAGLAHAGTDWVAVLTPERPEIVLPSLDAVVYGRVFATKRAPTSPLAGLDATAETRATWRIGMIHGALAIPGKTDGDEVVFSEDEIARTGLDYLALGHWHSSLEGRAGSVSFAYSGAPEPVAVDQDGAGDVLLVTLDDRGGKHVTIEAQRVGKTRCETLEFDVAAIRSQPALIESLSRHADPDTILDVRLTGLFPDDLDLDVDEVEKELSTSFLRLRIRDLSIPGLSDEPLPPADTVIGAFIRIVEDQIAALESGERIRGAGVVADGARQATATDRTIEPPTSDGAALSDGMPVSTLEADLTPQERGAVEPADGDTRGGLVAQPSPDAPPGDLRDADLAPALVAAGLAASPLSSAEQQRLDELADLREVLRLGRHLLEGRQVTL